MAAEAYTYDQYFGSEKSPKEGIRTHIDKNGRVFFRFFAAGPGINRHDWGVDTDYIADNMPTLMSSEITFMKAIKEDGTAYYPHPAIPGASPMVNQAFQKPYVVGKPVDYERRPDKYGNWYGIGEATEPHFKEFLKEISIQSKSATNLIENSKAYPIFVSPQILHHVSEDPHKIKKWWFQHVTITDDPAYPAEFAKITGACEGEEQQCMATLKQASMAKLQMGCIKMALKELIEKNLHSSHSNNNTSLIAKRATHTLETMSAEQTNESNTQQSNENNADVSNLKPEFQQPNNVPEGKLTEHIEKLVGDLIKDQALTPREKELIAKLDDLNKQYKEKDTQVKELQTTVDGIQTKDKKRDVELLLIQYEQAFKNKDGKFDEKAFNDEVEHWMSKNMKIEDIKDDIERAMRYAVQPLQPTGQQYAGSGQSDEGQTIGEVFKAPEVGANLDTKTEQASMSELVDADKVWFARKLSGGRIA